MVGTRVVVVSEDAAERHDLWAWLLSAGCDPLTGNDFRSGKRLLQSNQPDLLVTAVRLGEYNGLHLVIYGRHRDSHLKAIVIGQPDAVLQAEAQSLGAVYFTRPVHQTQFLQSVLEVVQAERPMRKTPRKRVTPIEALADTVQSRIVDISYDGLRLEIERRVGYQLPRTFTVRIPGGHLALAAQWVWSAQDNLEQPVVSYGVRLRWNDPSVHAQWRSLVDTTAGYLAVT